MFPAPDCTVFIPAVDDGQPCVVATATGISSSLDQLGRLLWQGTRGIQRQSELCFRFGGMLPMMAADGSCCYSDPLANFVDRLGNLPPDWLAPERLAVLTMLVDSADGSIAPEAEAALDALPAAKRFGGKMPFSPPASHLLSKRAPAWGDIYDGGGKEHPTAAGADSAMLFARALAAPMGPGGIDDLFGFNELYFFDQGRWLTAFVPLEIAGRGPAPRPPLCHAWTPVSQALAFFAPVRSHDDIASHLARWATPEDKEDLAALYDAVDSSHLFGGDPQIQAMAASWKDDKALRESVPMARGRPSKASSL